mgnify:FL=1
MEGLSLDRWAIETDFLGGGTAPLVLDHVPRKQIGVVENVSIDDDKILRADVRLGKSALASEVFDDIVDGIRQNISVGYLIKAWEKVKRGNQDGYRVTLWQPLEISIVSIPADTTVGVGRNNDEDRTMPNPDPTAALNADEIVSRATAAAETIMRDAATRASAIADSLELAAQHNLRSEVDNFLTADVRKLSGESILAAVRGFVLSKIPAHKPLTGDQRIGLTDKDARRFSIVNLVRALADPNDRTALKIAGFELEACQAASDKRSNDHRSANALQRNGHSLPVDVMDNWDMSKRTLNVSDDAALVPTDFLAGSFIDMLRKKSSVMRAGATLLTGLQGNVDIPRQVTGAVATWVNGEHTDATASEGSFDKIGLTPKDLAAYTDMSRRMLQQSSPGIEGIVRNDLLKAIYYGTDLAALEGSAASGQPRGVFNQVGINRPAAWAAATPTWAELLAMPGAIDDDEALDGNLAWIGRSNLSVALMSTPKVDGYPQYLMDNDDRLAGYPYIKSNQGTSGRLYFGNWSDVLIGFWSGLELMVDPYSLATKAGLRLHVWQTCDVAVRHPESFVWNKFGA